MRRREKSIKEKLDLDSVKAEIKPIINPKEILKHPATKIVIAGITIYGFLKVSKYFINAYVEFRKALENAKR